MYKWEVAGSKKFMRISSALIFLKYSFGVVIFVFSTSTVRTQLS